MVSNELWEKGACPVDNVGYVETKINLVNVAIHTKIINFETKVYNNLKKSKYDYYTVFVGILYYVQIMIKIFFTRVMITRGVGKNKE